MKPSNGREVGTVSASVPGTPTTSGHECHEAIQHAERPPARGRLRTIRDAVVACVGAILAIVPHVLHHIGLVVGAAFLTGAGGSALLYVLGLVFTLPMLRRLQRRFGSWTAPAIAVAIFTAVFALSAFVIGPAISGIDDSNEAPPAPSQKAPDPDPHGH